MYSEGRNSVDLKELTKSDDLEDEFNGAKAQMEVAAN